MLFWYRTPQVLHRYDSKVSKVPRVCCRCHGDVVTQVPTTTSFRNVPLSNHFGPQSKPSYKTFDTTIPIDPINYLLGLPIPEVSQPAQKLIEFDLLAAKRVIPLGWLSTSPPTLSQLMEHLTAVVHDFLPQCSKIWELWDNSVLNPNSLPLTSY